MARSAKKKVIFKLHTDVAKAFTSQGVVFTGDQKTLPAAEAGRFIDLGVAQEVKSAAKET